MTAKDSTSPTTLSVRLELRIKEDELNFLLKLAEALNLLHPPREITIQDVLRGLIKTRMRDVEELENEITPG